MKYKSNVDYLKSAIRKNWLRIIPWLLLLYIINYLNRITISFAIPGIESSLGITAEMAGLASGIFFIGYFIFQIPGTFLVHKYGARTMVTLFLIGWGVFSILNSYVQSVIELYIVRFMIGFMEGAFFPGLIYYISFWFPKKQMARANALFLTAVPISNIIGSPILGNIVSLYGWRIAFTFGGIPAIIFGILTWFYLPDFPDKAPWLSDKEKTTLLNEIMSENQIIEKSQGKYTISKAFKEKKTILLSIIYFFWMTNLFAILIWSPDILLLGSKYGISYIGWILAGVWLIGLIAMVSWAWHSDKTGERLHHTSLGLLIALVGSIIAFFSSKNLYLLLFALILLVSGLLMPFGSFWAIPTEFLTAEAAATSIGLINSIGNLGGFIGPYLIGLIETTTGSFIFGYSLIALFFILAIISIYILKFLYKKS